MKNKKDTLDIVLYVLLGLLGGLVTFLMLYLAEVIKF